MAIAIAYSATALLASAGVLGALIANSTGAGGGVVFIPLFQYLELNASEAVATSFAIQWFGMSTGALSWCYAYKQKWYKESDWPHFIELIAICAAASIGGIWTNYFLDLSRPGDLGLLFSVFSLFFGIAILATLSCSDARVTNHKATRLDYACLIIFSYLGGIFTAWVSVGVGEFIAVWLILRRFNPAFSIAVAVVVSALTVWSAMPLHLFIDAQVNWDHASVIIPGAIVGALCARHLVIYLGTRRLKLYFAICLLLIGLKGI